MNTKTIFAAAAIALSMVAVSAPAAQAGVSVDISLGGFFPGYDDGYGHGSHGHYGGHGYHGGHGRPAYGISCDTGRREVRGAGFNRVHTIECGGSSFTYSGWRYGDRFQVKVSRRSGEIIAVSEVY